MSISKRDQRLRVYQYVDEGANGRIKPTFQYLATWWGRIETPTGATHAVGTQQEHTADAVIAFPMRATVPRDSVVVGPDGAAYRVVAVLPRRGAYEFQVMATFADDAARRIGTFMAGGAMVALTAGATVHTSSAPRFMAGGAVAALSAAGQEDEAYAMSGAALAALRAAATVSQTYGLAGGAIASLAALGQVATTSNRVMAGGAIASVQAAGTVAETYSLSGGAVAALEAGGGAVPADGSAGTASETYHAAGGAVAAMQAAGAVSDNTNAAGGAVAAMQAAGTATAGGSATLAGLSFMNAAPGTTALDNAYVYVLPTDTSSTTRTDVNGKSVTFQVTGTFTGHDHNGYGAPVDGAFSCANNATPQSILITGLTAGNYNFRLAGGGSAGNSRLSLQLIDSDGTTVLAFVQESDALIAAGQFVDATKVLRTSAADWIANNAPVAVTVSGTQVTIKVGYQTSAYSAYLAALSLEPA